MLNCFSRVQFFGTPWTPEGSIKLFCPWNSPGKNTGVGFRALLQGIFPIQGLNPYLLMSPALAGGFFTTSTVCVCVYVCESLSHVQLFNPTDCSPPNSSVHWILQARILEWVIISFSRGSCRPRDQTQVTFITGGLFTIWAIREAHELSYFRFIFWCCFYIEIYLIPIYSLCIQKSY